MLVFSCHPEMLLRGICCRSVGTKKADSSPDEAGFGMTVALDGALTQLSAAQPGNL
jgi:hypothetical protein